MNASLANVSPMRRLARWLCVVYVVFSVGRVGELVPALNDAPIGKILLGLWAVCLVAGWRSESAPLPADYRKLRNLFLAFAVLAVASVSFSIWPGGTVGVLQETAGVLAVSVALLLLTGRDETFVRSVLLALVFAGTMLACTLIVNYDGSRTGIGRTYDPNDLAYVMVTVIPIAAALGLERTGFRRLALLGATAAMTFTVLLTQSRGGLIALVTIGVMALFMPLGRRERRAAAKSSGSRWIVRLLLIGVFGMATWAVAPPEAKQRLSTVTSLGSDYNLEQGNTVGRLSTWTRNFGYAIRRPIGAGLGSSPMVDVRSGGRFRAIHNSVLQVFVELGVLGLFVYLKIYHVAWRVAGVLGRRDPRPWQQGLGPGLGNALRMALAANFVAGFFLSNAYVMLVWVMFGAVALLAVAMKSGAKESLADEGIGHPGLKRF